ncbi:MAG TPA: UDP-3-O-(3-hydroxymyristoyl)glucosamine N-acyltransferase [Bryobacteraceae bacterium]|nr:UDP-3-O-(3-hydroxymyristoyl)glucosamine N-acyltransferase [Bryobacteraceae bacterium]
MRLLELAERIGCALRGDGDVEISGVAGMEHATACQITFLANPKYAHKVKSTKAGAIILHESAGDVGLPALLSENPYLDFARALEQFYRPPRPEPGIHPTAVVHPTAEVGAEASIGAYCVVGAGVRIGCGAVMYPHVVIYDGCQIGDDFTAHSGVSVREATRIGDRVILQNNVVVGADGYGFAKRADGSHYKIVQSGPVVIEDDVEIQSMSNVDRATVGETRIREGAKIDSMVQIGHACEVGERSIICSQTGLAGSTVLKKDVLLAGQVGVSGHLTIHENAVVYAQSGIGGDIEAGAVMSGSPAFDAATWRRAVASFPKLPEMVRAMRQLEKRLAVLENQRIKEEE